MLTRARREKDRVFDLTMISRTSPKTTPPRTISSPPPLRPNRRSPNTVSSQIEPKPNIIVSNNANSAKHAEERMKLIVKALQGWDGEISKLFKIDTWVELLRKLKRGDERRLNNDGKLRLQSRNIIEQISSPNYVYQISQVLSNRRGRQADGRRSTEFLYLADEYCKSPELYELEQEENEPGTIMPILGNIGHEDENTGDENRCSITNRIQLEMEGEKENAAQNKRQTRNSLKTQTQQTPLRIKSSQTLETSLTRGNNLSSYSNNRVGNQTDIIHQIALSIVEQKSSVVESFEMTKTIRRSPTLLGMGPDDEVIENDTPPPTPLNELEPEIIIPRKRTRFNSNFDFDRSPASLSNNNIRGRIDLSKKLVDLSSFGSLGMDDFPRSSRDNSSSTLLEPYSFDYGFEENSCSTLNGRDFNHDDLPDLEPPDTGRDKENLPKSEQEIVRDYPKPQNCPELKPNMFEEIEEALSRPKKDKVVSAFGLTLMQEQLAVYNKSEWLEDANIDFYLEMIKDRNNRANSGYSKVYIFQSYFYKLLDKRGYESVQGATGKDNIFEYDLVLIPIHSDHHWVLVVVNFNEKTMKCYDSMDHDNERHLRVIGSFLKREWREVSRAKIASQSMREIKRLSELNDFLEFDEEDDYYLGDTWATRNLGAEEIPQQKNGRDCGIFCLQFAEYLSRGHAFDFEQKHTAYFRKRMLYETLKKTLLIS